MMIRTKFLKEGIALRTFLNKTKGYAPPLAKNELLPEDIKYLKEESLRIMSDPRVFLKDEEIQNFLFPSRKVELLEKFIKSIRLVEFFDNKKIAEKLIQLVVERLHNEELKKKLGIKDDFNCRSYFVSLHVWIFHKYLLQSRYRKSKGIDKHLYEQLWQLISNLILAKKIPQVRLNTELKHVQQYMFGMSCSLDVALSDDEILPGRMAYTLWANVYSGEISRESFYVQELTKYVLRQMFLILKVDYQKFINVEFSWADF